MDKRGGLVFARGLLRFKLGQQFAHGRGQRRVKRFVQGEPDLPLRRRGTGCKLELDGLDVESEVGKAVCE